MTLQLLHDEYFLIYDENLIFFFISVCPIVGIGTLPPPRQRVCPFPQNPRGRGHTRLRVMGWGSPNSDDWKKA
jgi:hypothetical protein